MATGDKILLGYGIVSLDATPIGLTRGGSSFIVEREVRPIEADGDYGPVKGRLTVDKETAKLTVNALELFTAADMVKHFPGTALTAGATEDEWNSTLAILATDYHTVKWQGTTKDGKAVVIEVENAINMGNFELNLEDKNEAVPAIEYTATYLESARTTPPWSIKFGKGAVYSVTLTITTNGTTPITGAVATVYSIADTTAADGIAAFANIPEGQHAIKVEAGGYETYFATITVSGGNFTDTITMTAIS